MGLRDAFRSFMYGPDLENRVTEPIEQRQWGYTVPSWQLDKPQWPLRNTTSYRTLGYEALPVVYACVNARAQSVSAATVRAYREVPEGPRENIPDHPIRVLMRAPNPRMSEAEFLLQTIVCMDVAGFALIEKVRAGPGNIVELWHLRPDWARPIYRSNGSVDWEYRIPGRAIEIIRDQDVIVVSGGVSVDFNVTGMSPLAVALRELGIENAATDFLKNYFDHGGAPRYVITTDKEFKDQAQVDLIRERFAQVHQGVQNWNRVGILTGGATIQPVSDTLVDMAYADLRRLTDSHICQVFGVPPVIVGAQVGLDAATYSNYELARRTFYQDTIRPLWGRLDGAFTRSLLPELEVDAAVSLEFDTENIPALQEDKNQLFSRMAQALSLGGMTLNQFQQHIGNEGFGPDGEVLYLPTVVSVVRPEELGVLADETAAPPQPVPPQLAPGGPTGPAGPNDQPTGATGVTGPTGADATKAAPYPGDHVVGPKLDARMAEIEAERASRREVRQMFVDGDLINLDAPLYRLDAEQRGLHAIISKGQITRLAGQFAPQLRAFWQEQGTRIVAIAERTCISVPFRTDLDHMPEWETLAVAGFMRGPARKHFTEDEQRDIAAIDWNDELKRLTDLILPHDDHAATLATNRVARSLNVGVSWDTAHPNVRKVRNDLARRIVGINDTTRQDVQRVVSEGLTEGVTMPQLSDRLAGLFDETYQGRAMTVSRTESRVAYGRAAVRAYQDSHVVAAAELMDNPNHGGYGGDDDGLTCAERDGMIVSLDDAPDHIDGTHPNCILAVAPVLYRPLGEAL